jgi:hypothetical protein
MVIVQWNNQTLVRARLRRTREERPRTRMSDYREWVRQRRQQQGARVNESSERKPWKTQYVTVALSVGSSLLHARKQYYTKNKQYCNNACSCCNCIAGHFRNEFQACHAHLYDWFSIPWKFFPWNISMLCSYRSFSPPKVSSCNYLGRGPFLNTSRLLSNFKHSTCSSTLLKVWHRLYTKRWP